MSQEVRRAFQTSARGYTIKGFPNANKMAPSAVGREYPFAVRCGSLDPKKIECGLADWPCLRPRFGIGKQDATRIKQPRFLDTQRFVPPQPCQSNQPDCR